MELHKGLFSCHLFQGMDSEKAENIIRLLKGKTKEYQKKEMILSEGDEIREIGILLSGEVPGPGWGFPA